MFFLKHRSTTLSDSGLLAGFTDWHSHILPAVDDGAQTVDDSLQILSLLENEHVAHVYLTPHIMEDMPNQTEQLKERFAQFQALYQGPIKLSLAAENMLDNLFEQRLKEADLLPLCDSKRQLLVETSYFNPPMDLHAVLARIKAKQFHPVLAHPERYLYMDEKEYRELKSQGILFQLNLPSLVGAYGQLVQKKARILLDKGWYDLCGMDIHSPKSLRAILQGKLTRKEISKVREIVG